MHRTGRQLVFTLPSLARRSHGEQHGTLGQIPDQVDCGGSVALPACRQRSLIGLGVDKSMDFGCRPGSRTTETIISTPIFCRRALLMDADNEVSIICTSASCALACRPRGGPTHLLLRSDKVVVAGGACAVSLWQIAPWRTGSQHPEEAAEHPPVIDARHSSRLVGQLRLDHDPFEIGPMISGHAEANRISRQYESR